MRMRSLFPVVVVGLCFCASVSNSADRQAGRVELASEEVVVPFEMTFGRPVVEVKIGGAGPFKFLLDTGAGGTVIAAELADELKLPVTRTVGLNDSINPKAIRAKEVRVESMAMGGAVFSGLRATRMEKFGARGSLGARGILGMPLFADLLLTLDYGRRELHLRQGALPDPDGKVVLPYRRSNEGHIYLPITVATLELEALVDSGSPHGIVVPARYMNQLPFEAPPVETGKARTVNSEFVVHTATLAGTARVGGHVFEKPTLRFGGLPVGNLGNQVLSRFAITIDQKLQRIEFADSAH